MKRNAQENTGRVIALAIVFFGTLAAIAWAEGVFAKLHAETLAALAVFAAGYAVATYLLDSGVRRWIHEALKPLAASLRKAPAKSPGGTRAAT